MRGSRISSPTSSRCRPGDPHDCDRTNPGTDRLFPRCRFPHSPTRPRSPVVATRITAFHVIVNRPAVNIVPSPYPTAFAPVALEEDSRRCDEPLRRSHRSDRRAGPRHRLRGGGTPDIPPEVLARAAVLPADLIVMGTHGRGGFDHLVLGSVTEKVLRKALCPVLTVTKKAQTAPDHAAIQFHRILCAVDFSGVSVAAVEFALSLAEEADARLTLLHVIEVPHGLSESPWDFDVDSARARLESDSARRLQELVPDVGPPFLHHRSRRRRRPGRAGILRVAGERESDLIVMGVHGRGALDLMVFGSIPMP